MATLESLKRALLQKTTPTPPPRQCLSDSQYRDGFDTLVRGSQTYQDFIIPQLSQLLAPLFDSRVHISVLEIGAGPKSVLEYLPANLRRKISRYTAFEPNDLFASSLEDCLRPTSDTDSPFPGLESAPDIRRTRLALDDSLGAPRADTSDTDDKYDVVLFCHSMYGMNPKRKFIEQALGMLVERPEDGMIVVFHRDGTLDLDGLVCHRTASFPTGLIRVVDDDEVLDCFARFIAGVVLHDVEEAARIEWREVCRALGRRDKAHAGHILFSAPDIMAIFTKQATALPELTAQVPLVTGDRTVKNRQACLHRPAAIVKPTDVPDVQRCVLWALKHRVGLAVFGGGHGGQCIWPNVVSVDMGAFAQVHVLTAETSGDVGTGPGALVVAGAGCKTGDIISKAMAAGVTVPLGSRPSVGAGLWLQGGIGHLARLHGLACDAIVGAVVVSVVSGEVLYVGHVPVQHRLAGATRAENDAELLWAIRGAGTNFGIVVSVTFKAYPAPTYVTRNWVAPLSNDLEARHRLGSFANQVAGELGQDCSADAYLYWEAGQLHLGVNMFEISTTGPTTATPVPSPADAVLGTAADINIFDGVGVFDAEMYMSTMHGGHGGGKTSSFKRCMFLNDIGAADVADCLVAAVKTRPSPLCYLHLLHGGGAVGDTTADDAAFGCRDWDFACVVTGVWPRDHDGTGAADASVRWVYEVVADLLPLSCGAYGADLGPDPRDAALAAKAFGPNRSRLARLKRTLDPQNVLAYACPLPEVPMEPKLIVLVTGECGAGKDYCAGIWASVINKCVDRKLTARAVSISDATKREYAAATGADIDRLLRDRAYKEQHRPALTEFFQCQLRERPQLPEEHFRKVVYGAAGVDVLVITGMRDNAPVASFSHLVPDSRLLEVRVQASGDLRQVRRECNGEDGSRSNGKTNGSTAKAPDHRPCFNFDNNTPGDEEARKFAKDHLLPFLHEDLQRVADMVRCVPDFPRPGIDFRHVLDIARRPGGLSLCTSLLQSHFTGDWANTCAIACCEAGGFIFASALASRVNVPLVLIRDAGKLPPPVVSVAKLPSHISSPTPDHSKETRIEMERGAVPRGASVVVVDDVLATGETLFAVLQLLGKSGVDAGDITVMTVAEFPVHRGRELLRRRGFGRVHIQSLLVFGGA